VLRSYLNLRESPAENLSPFLCSSFYEELRASLRSTDCWLFQRDPARAACRTNRRLTTMTLYPVFLSSSTTVLLVGGGELAEQKLEGVSFREGLTVIAPQLNQRNCGMGSRGRVHYAQRNMRRNGRGIFPCDRGDMMSAEVNHQVYEDGKLAGALATPLTILRL